jgi:hypothetical protein
VGLDLRRGFFLDRSHHDLEPLGASRIQNQERKFAVARDKADTLHFSGQGSVVRVSAGLLATDH